jgi:hypothetical protein
MTPGQVPPRVQESINRSIDTRKETITMPHINRDTKVSHDVQTIAGIKKDLQDVTSLPLGGSAYTMVALQQFIQSRIDAINKANAAHAAWADAVGAFKALDPEVTKVVRALRDYVINRFGEKSPVLADFGFTPTTRKALTSEEKVAKAKQAEATRKARGTIGPKQKAKIKGTVATTAPATPPAASAPSPAVAPAPVAVAPPVATPSVAPTVTK